MQVCGITFGTVDRDGLRQCTRATTVRAPEREVETSPRSPGPEPKSFAAKFCCRLGAASGSQSPERALNLCTTSKHLSLYEDTKPHLRVELGHHMFGSLAQVSGMRQCLDSLTGRRLRNKEAHGRALSYIVPPRSNSCRSSLE